MNKPEAAIIADAATPLAILSRLPKPLSALLLAASEQQGGQPAYQLRLLIRVPDSGEPAWCLVTMRPGETDV